jgi:hypothetical protein
MFNFTPDTMTAPNKTKTLKRFGLAGTLFFTVKGLLWLIVPALIAKGF